MSSKINSTRNRILKATWKLLESGQSSAVRMADIAKAAKISRQALYLHFPNRADLLVETTRYLDEIHQIDRKLAPSRCANSGQERLQLWVDVWGSYIPVIYGVAKALMALEDQDPDAKAAWQDRKQAVRNGCAAAVSALSMDGDLRNELEVPMATDILWTLLSVRTWEQLCLECHWTQESYIEFIQKLAKQALVKDQSPPECSSTIKPV